ncbi:hypothetical protein ABT144_05480 [Streptomyces sp. NPDC002039]|uniref:hypothetical protein n=1 Tax=Streptomyces sp. NPDC002039 TaxID=3154660 RepID=UPI0033295579
MQQHHPGSTRARPKLPQEPIKNGETSGNAERPSAARFLPIKWPPLGIGCRRTDTEYGTGLARHSLVSKVVKGRRWGGEADEWVVIDEVVRVVNLAEQLTDAGPGQLLFGRFSSFESSGPMTWLRHQTLLSVLAAKGVPPQTRVRRPAGLNQSINHSLTHSLTHSVLSEIEARYREAPTAEQQVCYSSVWSAHADRSSSKSSG